MKTETVLASRETQQNLQTPFAVLRELPGIVRAWPAKQGAITFEMQVAADEPTGGKLLLAGEINAAGEVTILPAGTDPKIPALATERAANPQAKLVVHRLGKRAVLIAENTVIKVTRPGKTKAPINLAQIPTAPAILIDPAAGISKFVKLPGKTLHDLGDAAGAGWMAFIKHLGVLPTLTAEAERVNPQPFTAADEQRHLETWIKHVENHGTLNHLISLKRLWQAADKVAEKLSQAPSKLVATHRDLHDKQVLWDGKTAYLLDLDTFCLGPAGLDLGNLTAHLELRKIQGKISPEFKQFVLQQLAQLPDYEHHPAYNAATQLRLAAVYSFRPRAAKWLPAWIENTLTTVEEL
ncbi:phosphotransferase [Gleimia sp. 6138-11-ORH1]|uniref:phosphotransferase family protein n=1 Tax=Gleimia sp. 6138-11-ORH1 TaxID=2973937 RepID=UPI00216A8B13|nr:phosphotransferase [Gleimia sp. 6138-11-ORH1]MCS4484934.1 phosphotransferase [Gleimia sp. 6138-11-ORH1]